MNLSSDTDMTYPKGATHFSVLYEGDPPMFWVVKATDWSREHCKWYYNWYYWDRNKWVLDRSASSRNFRPMAEFDLKLFG